MTMALDRAAREPLAQMMVRSRVAQFPQHPREPLVGRREIGIGGERGAIVLLGGERIAVLGKDVGKIDPRDRAGGMARRGLTVGRAGGRAMAAGVIERAEIGERIKTGGKIGRASCRERVYDDV